MKTKLLTLGALTIFAVTVSAQETKPTLKQEVKKDAKAVGTSVKQGAEWTGETIKKGAKATEKGIKKGAKWTEKTAKKGGKAVKEGYEDTKDYVRKETK
ncbi:hypothetical protein [Kaistella palustris]|uniref:hypothetical protein n=1 Tax=Kaistella palustris TaxID=493376 RepID=UPI00040F90AF|nr:hypothetical protein [Kaistella palustris]